MLTKLKLKRGSSDQIASYSHEDGEVLFDKTKGRLVVSCDGELVELINTNDVDHARLVRMLPVSTNITISVSDWSSEKKAVKSLDGIRSDSMLQVGLPLMSTTENMEAVMVSGITVSDATTNQLTFLCINDVPTIDVVVQVTYYTTAIDDVDIDETLKSQLLALIASMYVSKSEFSITDKDIEDAFK